MDKQILNILNENKHRNKFYKEETFLVGLFFVFLSVLFFYLGGWAHKLSFSVIIAANILVPLKLMNIFSQRIKKYSKLIAEIEYNTLAENVRINKRIMFASRAFSKEQLDQMKAAREEINALKKIRQKDDKAVSRILKKLMKAFKKFDAKKSDSIDDNDLVL